MTKEEKELLLCDICARLQYGLKGQVVIEASTGEYDILSGHLEYTDVDVDVELFGIEGEDITVYPIDDKYNDVISDYNYTVDDFLPYLRPLSSMTEEEKEDLKQEHIKDEKIYIEVIMKAANGDSSMRGKAIPHFAADWCNKNHFDFRGLIPMGLALEASKDMYNKKEIS